MGKAIVASRLEQIGEVLRDGENALLIEPGNVKELTTAISLLIQDAELRRKIGMRAREDVAANYTWQHNVQNVIDRLTQDR